MTAPVDENGRVVVSEVRKLMNSNTVLLVGSAPTFPQSVIDPIEELAALDTPTPALIAYLEHRICMLGTLARAVALQRASSGASEDEAAAALGISTADVPLVTTLARLCKWR